MFTLAAATPSAQDNKHIRSIFAKLDLAPDDRVDRRVAAVLHYLDKAHG